MKRTAIVLALMSVVGAANAAGLGTANSFNAFVFGNVVTNGGHSDGAVAAGGNWTGSGYDALLMSGQGASYGAYSNIGTYVNGSMTMSNNGSVNNSGTGHVAGSFSTQNPYNMNGGTLYIGGTKTGTVNGSSQTGANTVDSSLFTSQYAYSVNQSQAIKALGGTAIDTSNQNNWAFNVSSQAGNQKVYSIAASDLSGNRTLDISGIGANDTVLINVTGTNVSGFGVTVNTNTGGYNQILWNFADATAVNINNRALHGSILAPLAAVSTSQNIDGNLIAGSWTNNNSAEIHFGSSNRFSGNAPVPEPATWAVISFGVMVMVSRRKNRAVRKS